MVVGPHPETSIRQIEVESVLSSKNLPRKQDKALEGNQVWKDDLWFLD